MDSQKLGTSAITDLGGSVGPAIQVENADSSPNSTVQPKRSLSKISKVDDLVSSARAQVGRQRTVNLVPKLEPPPTTRAGHLHATGAVPHRPVGSIPIDASPHTSVPLSPMRSVTQPSVADGPEMVVTRTLDCGRLRCDDLIAHAGWSFDIALEADLSIPGRVALRPKADAVTGPLAHQRQPHVLHTKRMLIPGGIRTFLGIDADATVIAISTGDGVITIASSAIVVQAIKAMDEYATYISKEISNVTNMRTVRHA